MIKNFDQKIKRIETSKDFNEIKNYLINKRGYIEEGNGLNTLDKFKKLVGNVLVLKDEFKGVCRSDGTIMKNIVLVNPDIAKKTFTQPEAYCHMIYKKTIDNHLNIQPKIFNNAPEILSIWNSQDYVTPFGFYDKNKVYYQHTDFHLDRCQPDYKTQRGDLIWTRYTKKEAEQQTEKFIEMIKDNSKDLSPEYIKGLKEHKLNEYLKVPKLGIVK